MAETYMEMMKLNIELDEDKNSFLKEYHAKGKRTKHFIWEPLFRPLNFVHVVTQNNHHNQGNRRNVEKDQMFKNKNLVE